MAAAFRHAFSVAKTDRSLPRRSTGRSRCEGGPLTFPSGFRIWGMKQQVFAAVVTAVTMLGGTAPSAQQPAAPPTPATAPVAAAQPLPMYQVPTDANTTREQLQEILRQYPPSVGEVLRRDPPF